jgi:membrane-associated phospholipid phosphatase
MDRKYLVLGFMVFLLLICLQGSTLASNFVLEDDGENKPEDGIELAPVGPVPEDINQESQIPEIKEIAKPDVSKESLFSTDYFKLLFEDTKYVLTSPTRWGARQWMTFSVATLGVGAVALLDKPVWNLMRRNQTGTIDKVADIAANIGGYSTALFVPFYVAGEVFGDIRAKKVALDIGASSLIGAGIISPLLKFVAGRSAPRENEGTYTFRPFSYRLQLSGGPQSFPSGHAAQTFTIAAVISSHYKDLWVRIAAYSFATVTSIPRIYQGVHFISDFAAGVIIGTVVGTTVVHFNEKWRKEKRQPRVVLLPFANSQGAGLALTIRLDNF